MAQNELSTKLGPRYLGSVLVVSAIYAALAIFLPSLSSLLWLVAAIAGYMAVSTIKQNNTKQLSDQAKLTAVWYLAFSPLLVQAFYYYRLKDQAPTLAAAYNKIGWKVIAWEVLFSVVLVIAITPHVSR